MNKNNLQSLENIITSLLGTLNAWITDRKEREIILRCIEILSKNLFKEKK